MRGAKKIDILVLKTFLPPFFATLFVSVFLFFLVQIIVTYLDDFLGKGLRTWDLLTLFWYAWITLIPQCIPLAVLLASIMSFGSLAEHYELATLKACGISLFRIIRPVFIFIIFLALFTFIFNNNILPGVYLKFSVLLSDIRQKKPTINIKEGIFYNQITGYVIRVGKKDKNSDTLKQVMIYDHKDAMGNFIQIYSDKALLQYNADTTKLILKLINGKRYEYKPKTFSNPENNLNVMSFRNLNVFVDIRDFKFKRSDEKNFRGAEDMLNIFQLDSIADSTRKKILLMNLNKFEYIKHSMFVRFYSLPLSDGRIKLTCGKLDSSNIKPDMQWFEASLNILRNFDSYLENSFHAEKSEKFYLSSLEIGWHRKFVLSLACIVLFFIGAPLGAIIRKGGMGLPVVVSVIFFLAYYILTEFFTGLAMEYVLDPLPAMWLPVLIFLPISIFLTSQAATEAGWLDFQVISGYWESMMKKLLKNENSSAVQ